MKKYLLIIVTVIMIFTLSGCKKDSMEGINIYTSIYPIEYITDKLYGEYSNISSIYPNEVIKLSDKLLQDYSSGDLFIYNGLSSEKDYAVKMLNNNKNLMIVDATMGMNVEYSDEELWLNPSNFLMLCLNIKNGMKEYITNSFLKKQIDNNYDEIKLLVSELDAETKLMVENATDTNTILVSNDLFKYLEKYNLNVISLENNSELTDIKIAEAKSAIDSGTIKYIIMMPNDTLSDKVEELVASNNIEKLYYNSITTLSANDEKNGNDYLSIMRENLELLRKELYVE